MEQEFKIDFKAVEIKFQFQLDYFREYMDFNLKNLSRRTEKLDSMMLEECLLNPENTNVIKAIYFDEKNILPAYYYHSTLVGLYSMLENTLRNLGEIIVEHTSFSFSIGKMRQGDLITSYKEFLLGVADLDLKAITKWWDYIKQVQQVRNLIVHHNAYFKENTSPAIKLIVEKFGIIDKSDRGDRFYITDGTFLKDFLQAIEMFVKEILSQLRRMTFALYKKATIDDDFSWNPSSGDIPF